MITFLEMDTDWAEPAKENIPDEWLYLEGLRRSGVTNMFCAAPYIAQQFDYDISKARKILSDWMENYDEEDYKLSS